MGSGSSKKQSSSQFVQQPSKQQLANQSANLYNNNDTKAPRTNSTPNTKASTSDSRPQPDEASQMMQEAVDQQVVPKPVAFEVPFFEEPPKPVKKSERIQALERHELRSNSILTAEHLQDKMRAADENRQKVMAAQLKHGFSI